MREQAANVARLPGQTRRDRTALESQEHHSTVGRFAERMNLRTKHVPTQERLLYASENGDCWSLARDTDTGKMFVRHSANLSSGGQVSDIDLGAFLVQGGMGPEKQELLRLIGGLTEGPKTTPRAIRRREELDRAADKPRPTIKGEAPCPRGNRSPTRK